MVRQGMTMIPPEDVESREALGRWMIAFARSFKMHCQPDEWNLREELGKVLKPEELDMLEKSNHRPVQTLLAMSQVVQSAKVDPILQSTMSNNITAFHDILGGCERLIRAPIPVSFTRHTARFLFVWLTIMPFSLYEKCGPWTIVVTTGVAFALCAIEEIGVQCEEPFGILPLDVICKRIQTDVESQLKDSEQVRSLFKDNSMEELEELLSQQGTVMASSSRGTYSRN